MPDNIEEERYITVFDNVASFFWLIVLGLGLTGAAIFLLIQNESTAVSNEHFAKSNECREVSVAPLNLDGANEGKLLYIRGVASAEEALSDLNGLVKVRALRLERSNRFYQWSESKSEVQRPGLFGQEEETTYSYEKHYESKNIDSAKFRYPAGHNNPKFSESFGRNQVAKIHIGNYVLSKGFGAELEMLNFKLSKVKLPKQSDRKWNGKPYVLSDDTLIVCRDYNNPQIGDELIGLSYAPEGTYSVIGRQHGKEIEPIKLDNGSLVNSLKFGNVPSNAILKENRQKAFELVWGMRLAGYFLVVAGLYLLFVPLQALLQRLIVLQFLEACDPLEFAFTFGFSLSVVIIASFWIERHPQFGYGLYVIGIVSALAMYLFKTNQAAQNNRLQKKAAPLGSN